MSKLLKEYTITGDFTDDDMSAGYIDEDGSIIYVDEYHGEDSPYRNLGLPEFSSTHLDDVCIRVYKEPNSIQYDKLEYIIDRFLNRFGYCKIECSDSPLGSSYFYKVYSLYEGAFEELNYHDEPEVVGNWTGYKLIQIIKNNVKANAFDKSLGEKLLAESKQDQDRFAMWILNGFNGDQDKSNYLYNKYINLKTRLKSPENDFYYWIKNSKGPDDLLDFLNEQETLLSNNQKRKLDKDGAKLIWSKNGNKVYKITNYKAMQYYGRNTKWCIAGNYHGHESRGEEYFNDYKDKLYLLDNAYYVYITNDNYKYCLLITRENGQNNLYGLYNETDEEILKGSRKLTLLNNPDMCDFLYNEMEVDDDEVEFGLFANIKNKKEFLSIINDLLDAFESYDPFSFPGRQEIEGYYTDCLFNKPSSIIDELNDLISSVIDNSEGNLDKNDQEDIDTFKNLISRINEFTRKQNLNESLLLEMNRNQLINKSKKSDNYKDTSKGRNRWERRNKSKIATRVDQYNKIDMNSFFKNDELKVGINVHGETSDYVVLIRYNGVLKEIAEQIKRNNNKLEFKCILIALQRVFNQGDVFVSCSCADWQYRQSYHATRNGYNSGKIEVRASDITNPKDSKGAGCKHVNLVLGNIDWIMKVSSVINNYIHYMKDHFERKYADIIFPKLFGIPYQKAVQLNLFDTDDNLKDDESEIKLSNKYGRERTKFRSDHQVNNQRNFNFNKQDNNIDNLNKPKLDLNITKVENEIKDHIKNNSIPKEKED